MKSNPAQFVFERKRFKYVIVQVTVGLQKQPRIALPTLVAYVDQDTLTYLLGAQLSRENKTQKFVLMEFSRVESA